MSLNFRPNHTTIKGFASVSELLARPINDQTLNDHFILPDGQVGDPSWIGRDIYDVLPETTLNQGIGFFDIDDPAGELYASRIFFSTLQIRNCRWRVVNFNSSVGGDLFRVDDSNVGSFNISAVFLVEGTTIEFNRPYSGLQIWNTEFVDLILIGSSFAHFLMWNVNVSNLVQLESALKLWDVRDGSQIKRLDLRYVSADAIYIDTKNVGIDQFEALPVAAYEGIRALKTNFRP